MNAATSARPPAIYRIAPDDDVAVALRDLAAQESISVGDRSVVVTDPVPRGHKVAIRPVPAGQAVRKYGWPIGRAIADIAVGAHVHSHNLETLLSGTDEYEYTGSAADPVRKPAMAAGSFLGYRRANGKVGATVTQVLRYGERAGKALAADPETITDEFLRLIVATASGQPARNELNEQREIAIWKDGVTL